MQYVYYVEKSIELHRRQYLREIVDDHEIDENILH